MKKIIIFIFLLSFTSFPFSSEVSDLLKKVQNPYESEDISTVIQNLDSAKRRIEDSVWKLRL